MPYGAKGGDTPSKDRAIKARADLLKKRNPSMPASERFAIAKVQTGNGKYRTPHHHAQKALKGK